MLNACEYDGAANRSRNMQQEFENRYRRDRFKAGKYFEALAWQAVVVRLHHNQLPVNTMRHPDNHHRNG
jgi:hypothetical protein